jgi:hypothetical protein
VARDSSEFVRKGIVKPLLLKPLVEPASSCCSDSFVKPCRKALICWKSLRCDVCPATAVMRCAPSLNESSQLSRFSNSSCCALGVVCRSDAPVSTGVR